MVATITKIQRFPIKGLSAEPLDEVELRVGDGVPGDRMFGFARHGSGFDKDNPAPLPKDKFVVLLNQAALASLRTAFDPESGKLVIAGAQNTVSFDLSAAKEQRAAEAWLSDYLALTDRAAPEFVHAAPHRFTDVSVVSPQMMNAVSLLNLQSVRDLETRLGTTVDPARFRANIELDGFPAWWELDSIGTTLRCGEVELRLIKRTQRCAATEVNPKTAERDLRVPYLLRKQFGHMDMGVYAEVEKGGSLRPGTRVEIL